MKFLITENKLDNVIQLYLDNQDFLKKKVESDVIFFNSSGDDYGLIRADKDGWIWVSESLIDELKTFFSIEYIHAMSIIANWISSKLPINPDKITMQDVSPYHYRLSI